VSRLGYVPALDGIRGILIIAVIGVHYFGYPTGGYYSMEVFFALSGFLITTLLLEERDRTGGIALPAFYLRRAYRLLPALMTVLAAYALVTGSPARVLEQIAVVLFYATNVVIAAGSHLLDARNTTVPFWSPLTPFWSLAQEEQFYLLWPFLLLFLLRRRVSEARIAVFLVCLFIGLVAYRAGLGLAGASYHRLYAGPDTHADGLVLGCLLALLRRQGFRVPQWAGWLGLATLLLAYAFAPPVRTIAADAYGLGPMSIASALLVGAAVKPGFLSSCLSFRPLVRLGVMSYSLYLWHVFIFWLLDWRAPLVALPITLAVGALSYYVVEMPLRNAHRARSKRPPRAERLLGPVRSSGSAAAGETWLPGGAYATQFTGEPPG
jgi:peptidoglycan/LPS O-acetylase OafA/YrhL